MSQNIRLYCHRYTQADCLGATTYSKIKNNVLP